MAHGVLKSLIPGVFAVAQKQKSTFDRLVATLRRSDVDAKVEICVFTGADHVVLFRVDV